MIITYNDLIEKEACEDGLKYFLDNYPFGIETNNLNGIIVNSSDEKEYLIWLIDKFKFSCKFTYENSIGYWKKYEYYEHNDKGLKIYYENSDGYWIRYEYNDKGLQVYFEDSEGYWCKFEYDEKGIETYHENSKGIIKNKINKE